MPRRSRRQRTFDAGIRKDVCCICKQVPDCIYILPRGDVSGTKPMCRACNALEQIEEGFDADA